MNTPATEKQVFKWLVVAVLSVIAVTSLWLLTPPRAAHADDDLACVADTNTDQQIDVTEAFSAVREYLLGTSDLTREEVVDAVFAYLTTRTLTCEEEG